MSDAPAAIRLHDPARDPASWTGIIRPGQFAIFAKRVDGGGTCDVNGHPFPATGDITCLIVDSLARARQYCEAQVLHAHGVRFEVFDSDGRMNPPLLVVVHPSRAATLDLNPRGMRWRAWAAAVLVLGAFPLMWYDYSSSNGMLILPTFLGVNMLIIAARLMQLNMAIAGAERQRQERIAKHATDG